MTTTSLKLPDDLKQRTMLAAQQHGLSPHAFMINAIDQAATAAEQRASFLAEARAARASAIKSGKGFDADEVHAYLRDRIAGKKTARPKAKSWRG